MSAQAHTHTHTHTHAPKPHTSSERCDARVCALNFVYVYRSWVLCGVVVVVELVVEVEVVLVEMVGNDSGEEASVTNHMEQRGAYTEENIK